MNLADVLRINAKNHGERPAIIAQDETISFRNAWRIVRSLAGQLEVKGIEPGERVGLSMADHPVHLLAHFAVAYLGAVIVPIDHRWSDSEKSRAASAFRVKVVATDGDSIEGVTTMTLDGSRALESGSGEPAAGDNMDLLISLSSGTTGLPKGAIVTHENLYERFVSQWVAIGYDSRDCFAIVTPLFFGAGRSFGMSLLAAGGCVLLAPPPYKPPELLEALSRPEVTAAFVPPTLLRRLLPLHEWRPLLGHLDYLVVSGEPLYADEARECLDKICPNIYCYYASSEGGGISVLKASEIRERADSVGIPTFRTDVEIVDEDGRTLPDGQVGRLRYRGPGVATRSLDEDGNENDAGVDGWFYPGDLAERLPGGYLALRGRDKDVIIRGGVNVYPAEIERVLTGHQDVREAAVLGIDDAERGEIVVAFVAGSAVPGNLELADYCGSQLASYKIPQEFRQLEELPKKDSGKIDKLALRSTALD